ncbi:MAG: PorT family protein, partial [Cyclobacteriaceae bacterium]|nr:PorT family protein [Cyclobacteriaceae bacterium]
TYNVGNARIGLEVNYHYGLQNLDNGGVKYIDNQLVTGTYDVPDDYSLNNLEISMQVIIPLKFITSKDYVPL